MEFSSLDDINTNTNTQTYQLQQRVLKGQNGLKYMIPVSGVGCRVGAGVAVAVGLAVAVVGLDVAVVGLDVGAGVVGAGVGTRFSVRKTMVVA